VSHKVFIDVRSKQYLRDVGKGTLVSILVEMRCRTHGFERFRVKLIKRFNIASDQIVPKLRSKPMHGEITRLYVGRNVSDEEAQKYLISYFRERGMLEEIVRMRMQL
jgi:hypothetical protein